MTKQNKKQKATKKTTKRPRQSQSGGGRGDSASAVSRTSHITHMRNEDMQGLSVEEEWIGACDSHLMRFSNAPIASKVTGLGGNTEPRVPLYILSSSSRLLGEKKDASLEAFGMRVFASKDMLVPIGRNNSLPKRKDKSGDLTIYTDASHKAASVGISAMFDIEGQGTYAYAGTLLIDTELDGMLNAGETIAAVSAALLAIDAGYKQIRIMSDSLELIRMWNGQMTPRRTVMRQLMTFKGVVEARGVEIIMQHVYGHRADFMNVAADGVAQMHERVAKELTEPRNGGSEVSDGQRNRQPRQDGQPTRSQMRRARRRRQQGNSQGTSPETSHPSQISERPHAQQPQSHDDDIAHEEVAPAQPQVAPSMPSYDVTEDIEALCTQLKAMDGKIGIQRVRRSVLRKSFEGWPKMTPEVAETIRAMLCDDTDPELTPDMTREIWYVVAPTASKGLNDSQRETPDIIRVAILSRLCAAPLARTIQSFVESL